MFVYAFLWSEIKSTFIKTQTELGPYQRRIQGRGPGGPPPLPPRPLCLEQICVWNLLKLLSHTFYWGNVVRFLVHFFLTAAHFHLALVTAGISHCHRHFCWKKIPTKKCLLCFLSLALDLCRPFSRWASLACRLLSLFLCLSLALYSKFVDMTIILSLIL